jgi:hypothetical protein
MAKNGNRVSVLLAKSGLSLSERLCEERGYHKSTLIARVIREHLDAERFKMQGPLPLPAKELQ